MEIGKKNQLFEIDLRCCWLWSLNPFADKIVAETSWELHRKYNEPQDQNQGFHNYKYLY